MSARTRKLAETTENDPRWAALLARDADGEFYYAVKTTGVYCRPSCASRPPRPENVQFFTSNKAAEDAGFRSCKRCKPDQPSLAERHAATVAAACRYIEKSETPPALEELAARAGLSPWHFHRLFKSITGLTPKAYTTARRTKRVRTALAHSDTITHAIYDAGYHSNGRFYEKSNQMLGMTPSSYRAGGTGTEIRFAVGECSLGAVLVAMSERGICAILLGDDPEALVYELQDQFHNSQLIGGDDDFEKHVAKVIGFVEAPHSGIDLPLDIRGTAFQQRVWQALREIPVGTTASYTDIAKCIGAPKSVRAVARACAANSLAVAIPCHRVVRTDGGLAGYRWGVERKRALLERESKKPTK